MVERKRCDYFITGDTFQHREGLKNWGCIWNPDEQAWMIYATCPDDPDYKYVSSLEGVILTPIEDLTFLY